MRMIVLISVIAVVGAIIGILESYLEPTLGRTRPTKIRIALRYAANVYGALWLIMMLFGIVAIILFES